MVVTEFYQKMSHNLKMILLKRFANACKVAELQTATPFTIIQDTFPCAAKLTESQLNLPHSTKTEKLREN